MKYDRRPYQYYPTNRDGNPIALPSWSWQELIALCSVSVSIDIATVYGIVKLTQWII